MLNRNSTPWRYSRKIFTLLPRLFIAFVLLAAWPFANAQLEAADDDFIILDDRGDGAESEEDDVHLSGRKPRPSKPAAGASTRATDDKRDGKVSKKNEEPEPEVAPPRRFEPTERVSEDLSVSFPVDI